MKTLPFPLALVALVLVAAACAGPADGASNSSVAATSETSSNSGASVLVQNIAFQPESLNVLRGTEVTWTSGDANVRHTATSGVPGERAVAGVQEGSEAQPDGVFDGDLPDSGATFSFTFEEAGTYAYFCEIHPSMTAEIVVE